jgi:hypothetical protein
VLRFFAVAIVASGVFSQTAVFPLRDIRAGQKGVGRTVFSGNKIEEFQVEVLGVLENVGPKQNIILARLSGGPLERTGVMQGMSGSPVYIDGRLVGAVALAFNFAKEPIAGIRPIEEMLAVGGMPAGGAQRASVLPKREIPFTPAKQGKDAANLIEIATPVSFSGFTAETLDHFAPELQKLGLSPRQGVSSGGPLPNKLGNPAQLRPGDMISVNLLSGDYAIGAEGTVTHVDGSHIYAFGHRFMSAGDTEMPFARAEVLTLLPNLEASFKISSPQEWMGTITQDRSTSIYGELGRKAATIPLTIALRDGRRNPLSYRMEMVQDRILSPFVLQMAVYSAIDATERTLGLGSYTIRGAVEFERGAQPLKLDNTYSGDFNVPAQASLGVASPLSAVMMAGFDALKIKEIHLAIEASERKQALQIDQIAASRKEVHGGDWVDLTVTLAGENGVELLRTVRYQVPVGAQTGNLNFTAADGNYSNMLDYQQLAATIPKSPTQVISFLNNLRSNSGAYVRVWRTDPAFQVQGSDLPNPPASVGLILSRAQAAQGSWLPRGSKIDELEIPTGDAVVTGSKTVPVEVKE